MRDESVLTERDMTAHLTLKVRMRPAFGFRWWLAEVLIRASAWLITVPVEFEIEDRSPGIDPEAPASP